MRRYLAAYLGAIVAANLLATRFGPAITPWTAFAFIGLDLIARDRLHDAWSGPALWPRMLALIAAGSALSWLFAPAAGRVGIASLIAFAAAGLVDTIAYHLLRHRPPLERMNGSNLPAALIDSLLFPSLAFSQWLPATVLLQFLAKTGGGLFWSALLTRAATFTAAGGHQPPTSTPRRTP